MRRLVLRVIPFAWSYLVITALLRPPFGDRLWRSPNSKSTDAAVGSLLASHCAEVDGNDRCLAYRVSLLELVANPGLFDGRYVQVTGYVHLEFEGNALYLNRHDLDHHQYANGVWVEFETGIAPKHCQDQFVIIDGRFSSQDRGHMGMWSGAIREISRCQPW